MKTQVGKIYKIMASVKVAVVLLATLAAILAIATFYESLYDSKTAQHLVYGSPWFAGFLVVLFVNVLCSAAVRFPWKGYQTGFVVTHLGILLILTGSLQTWLSGVDGQMPIVEGGSNDRVTLDKPVLQFGTSPDDLKEIDAEFRWNPPRPDRAYRYPLGNGVTARVDGYYHHSAFVTQYTAAASGEPAVHLSFTSPRVSSDQWLTPGMGDMQIGLARVSVQESTQAEVDRLAKSVSTSPSPRKAARQLRLFITPEARLYYKMGNGNFGEMVQDKPLPTGWMDIQVTATEIFGKAQRTEVCREYKLKKNEKEGPPPALRVTLEGADKPGPFWLQQGGERIFAHDPQGKSIFLAYSLRNVSAGVRIELLRFEVTYDPGTRNPASFKSDVKVNGERHIIEMNEPLHVNKFAFYQASYQENPQGPQTSILSVAYDPGIFLKYLGSGLLVGGIFTMFYLIPHTAGRKRALTSEGLRKETSGEKE